MTERKIHTEQRGYQWLAWREEFELDEPVGQGKTEQAAIDELFEWESLDGLS